MRSMQCEFVDLNTRILELSEIRRVLEDLDLRRAHNCTRWGRHAWCNLIIFRLSCCCGLRSKEIRHIRLDDMLIDGSRPVIRIRKEVTKGENGKRKSRVVPLWWDQGTLDDIADWVVWRRATVPHDSQVVRADWSSPTNEAARSRIMPRMKLWKRWRSAIRVLGEDRASQLGVHAGRHSFCTHALQAGRSLMEVRDAAGHTNISTTQIYLHALETGNVPDLFPEDDDE